MMVEEGQLLWTPSPARLARSHLTRYLGWLAERGRPFEDYDALWRWSVSDLDAFWSSIAEFCGIEHAMMLTQLVNALSDVAGRPVVDRSGLTGTYDITLKWAPEFPPGTLINGAPPPPSDGPSLFTALREQLGLKLEPARAPVPVLVIDSVQMPTPD